MALCHVSVCLNALVYSISNTSQRVCVCVCARSPCMEEERKPETVELVRNFWVEEGKQPTHVIQTVNLCRSRVCDQESTTLLPPTLTPTHL